MSSTAIWRFNTALEDELEECRTEDVERRLEELGTLEAALGLTRVETALDVLSALANETLHPRADARGRGRGTCASAN
nr:hypothetical protein [Haloplanus sp. HW8-1]